MAGIYEYTLRTSAEPKVISTDGGDMLVIPAAWNDRVQNDNGEWVTKHTEWFDVKVFRGKGQLFDMASQLPKGSPIVVKSTKPATVRAYQKTDGTPGATMSIVANDIYLSLVQGIPSALLQESAQHSAQAQASPQEVLEPVQETPAPAQQSEPKFSTIESF